MKFGPIKLGGGNKDKKNTKEKKGFLDFRPDPQDRRCKRIYILEKGRRCHRQILQVIRGNEDRILLVSRFDNLGKGASGAAIQNMNLLLGLPQATGLNV